MYSRMAATCRSGSGPQTISSPIVSSVTICAASSNIVGVRNSWLSGPARPAFGQTSCAVRRAAFSSAAQQTVSCP